MQVKDETFYKTIQSFLDTYLIRQKNFSPKTKASYKKSLLLLLEYFKSAKGMKNYDVGFEDLTYENIAGFLEWLSTERRCSPQTVNNRLMAVRSFTKYAAILDPAKVSVQIQVRNVPAMKASKAVVGYLEEDALQALFQQPDTRTFTGLRDFCFMTLMYDVAARCSELTGLRVGAMELYGGRSSLYLTGKGNKPRRVPVSESVASNMKKYLGVAFADAKPTADSSVFFTSWNESRHRISPDAVALFMKKYAGMARRACGSVPENMHPHLLRHSRAMHLYRGGMPLALLSEFLGHSSIDTTRIYAWSDTEMKRNAIKTAGREDAPPVEPIWVDDETMVRRLYGLE